LDVQLAMAAQDL